MTAMQTLTQLVELKRASTDLEALDRYVAELYTATWAWTNHNPRNGIAALAYDALIDRIAHETRLDPPERRLGPPLTPLQPTTGLPSQPCPPRPAKPAPA